MKKYIFIPVILTGILCFLYFNIMNINHNLIYSYVGNKANFAIKDNNSENNIIVKMIPYPHVIIKKLVQHDSSTFNNIVMRVSPWSIFGKIKFSSITIDNIVLNAKSNNIGILNHDIFIKNLFDNEFLKNNRFVKTLNIANEEHRIIFTATNFQSKFKNHQVSFSCENDFLGSIKGTFSNASDQQNLVVNIESKHNIISLSEKYQKFVLQEAFIDVKTNNFVREVNNLLPDLIDLPDNVDANENVSVSFQILNENEGRFAKNISINSKSLTGSGECYFGNDNKKNFVKLHFDKANLQSWLDNKIDNNKSSYIIQNKNNSLYNSNIDITFDKIHLGSTEIKNMIFKTQNNGEFISIKNFKGAINDAGYFLIDGKITKNDFRSVFEGSLSVKHDNLNELFQILYSNDVANNNIKTSYILTSNLKLSVVDFLMSNIHLKTDNTQIEGNISKKYIGNNAPRTRANITCSLIDVQNNNIPGVQYLYNQLIDLGANMKDKKYLNKFIPIRTLKSDSEYNIKIDKLLLNNSESGIYKDIGFNLILGNKKLAIYDLIFSNKDHIHGDLIVDLASLEPVLDINIRNAKITSNIVNLDSMLTLKQKIINDFDLKKMKINFDFFINELKEKNITYNNITLQGNIVNNVIDIKKLNANFFQGTLVSYGNILLDPYKMNISYALKDLNLNHMNKIVSKKIINTGGKLSTSGMISSRGNSLQELLYYLYIKSKIILDDITFYDIALNDLIRDISKTSYSKERIDLDIKKYLLTGSTSVDSVVGQLLLENGVANITDIKFKTAYLTGMGKANFNIYNFQLDSEYNLLFSLPSNKFENVVRDPELNIPLHITGNFFTPKKELMYQQLKNILQQSN